MKLFAATIMPLAFASPALAEPGRYASPSERGQVLRHTHTENLDGGMVWLRYRIEKTA